VKRGSLAGVLTQGCLLVIHSGPGSGLSRPAVARSGGGGAAVKCARQPGRATGRVLPATEAPDTPVERETPTALPRLPLRQGQAVVPRLYLDLDTCSTAEVLGIAPGTVRAHKASAIAALRDEFTPLNEELHQ
jgi:hypothetical protein